MTDPTPAPVPSPLPDDISALLNAFWSYLIANFLIDIKAELGPDADAVLAMVEQGGLIALLQPANAIQVNALLLKLEGDALAAGNDLSKQVATFWRQWLAAKFAVDKAKPTLRFVAPRLAAA